MIPVGQISCFVKGMHGPEQGHILNVKLYLQQGGHAHNRYMSLLLCVILIYFRGEVSH